MKNTPRINRTKLLAMGREKILHACNIHYKEMNRLKASDPRFKIHQGLLAQCFMAFKYVSERKDT